MRILVTGGAGFIGSNFVRRCFEGKYQEIQEVIVLDSLTYAGNLENLVPVWKEKNFTFVKGSLTDKETLRNLIKDVDAVINFAAESHVDKSITHPSVFLETNILGVFEILDCIKSEDIRMIQVSTDEVYGSISEGSWDENSPLLPNSPYSASKASAEMICRSYVQTHNLNIVITRCSNNYGPFHHPEKFIPKTITNLLQALPVPIYGNGLNSRDWIHVDDHCDGIYLALIEGIAGESYNIGGNNEYTNIELVRLVLELMGETQDQIEYVPDRLGHDFRYSLDSSKSRIQLGFEPKINFLEGIAEVIQWYAENEKWWRPILES